MEDKELEDKAAYGDMEAFEHLTTRHAESLYQIAIALTRDRKQAAVLVSDAVALTWREAQHKKRIGDLVTVLHCNVFNIWKRRSSNRLSIGLDEEADEAEQNSETLAEMRSERSLRIEQAIEEMKLETRAVFMFTYISELSIPEIAKYIRASMGKTSQWHDKALAKIANSMGEDKEAIRSQMLKKYFAVERKLLQISENDQNAMASVQKGLQDAKNGIVPKFKIKTKWRWISVTVITAIAVLFIIQSWVPKETHATLNFSGTKVVPDESYFLSSISWEGNLRLRVEDKDYVMLGHAVEWAQGSRFILDGAMDLGSETIVWYTLEKNENGDQVSIYDGTITDLSTMTQLGKYQGHSSLGGEKDQGFIIFDRENPTISTEDALLQVELKVEGEVPRRVKLETDFPNEIEKPDIVYDLNESFIIEDQTFHITKLTMSSDYTLVSIVPDHTNSKGNESLNFVRLRVEAASSAVEYRSVENIDTSLIFPSIYYEEDYDEIKLTMEDRLFEPDYTIVINLDPFELIRSPEPLSKALTVYSMSPVTYNSGDSYYTLQFPKIEGYEYDLSNQFKDADGFRYETVTYPHKDEKGIQLLVPNKQYVQPLTFYYLEANSEDNLESGHNTHPDDGRIFVPVMKNPSL
ncbi:hypothetical protein M3231_01055 [Neobacillus mesonae]|nr:hypothetical protein [Neobacillus mesonae]